MIAPGSATAVMLASGLRMALVVSASTTNYNLKSAAIAAGWDGVTPLELTCTIAAGVAVGSSSTGNAAFDTGSGWPSGSILKLINNGYIVGKGGNGGGSAGKHSPSSDAYHYAESGQPGGPALLAQNAITVENYGVIGGGGGGGGGGGSESLYSWSNNGGGGGGGAGYTPGSGGVNWQWDGTVTAGNGGTGGLTNGGAGGTGGSSNPGNTGGNGGGLGQSGGSGTGSYAAGGASPGAATIGNAYITWAAIGSRLGSLT